MSAFFGSGPSWLDCGKFAIHLIAGIKNSGLAEVQCGKVLFQGSLAITCLSCQGSSLERNLLASQYTHHW
jgi:hypothetical protein